MKIENDCVVIELNEIWENLPSETKASFLQESGAWEVLEQELLYLQGRSLSSPNFNNTIHKVRELILTNPEFVSDMLISFVKTCLEQWSRAEQKKRASDRAYYQLYHSVRDFCFTNKIEAPSGWNLINQEHEQWQTFPSIRREDVEDDIMELFGDIIRDFSGND